MRQELILAPMGALALLTFLVLSIVPLRRFRAGFARQVTAADFRYGESAAVPGEVSLPNRAYMNLLELPVLFYVACALMLATGKFDATQVALAWVFVATRAVHAAIHIGINYVPLRFAAFFAGSVTLAVLWVRLAAQNL